MNEAAELNFVGAHQPHLHGILSRKGFGLDDVRLLCRCLESKQARDPVTLIWFLNDALLLGSGVI